jgi:hypothetical protein
LMQRLSGNIPKNAKPLERVVDLIIEIGGDKRAEQPLILLKKQIEKANEQMLVAWKSKEKEKLRDAQSRTISHLASNPLDRFMLRDHKFQEDWDINYIEIDSTNTVPILDPLINKVKAALMACNPSLKETYKKEKTVRKDKNR